MGPNKEQGRKVQGRAVDIGGMVTQTLYMVSENKGKVMLAVAGLGMGLLFYAIDCFAVALGAK